MNFDPLSIFDAFIGTKVDQSSFFEKYKSGPSHTLLDQNSYPRVIFML